MSEQDLFEARVSRLVNYLTRAHKHNKPSILFALYLSEFLRADVENSLKKSLEEQGTEIVAVDAGENKDIPSFISSINSKNTVFLVHNLEKGFPEALKFLNFKREELVDNKVKVIFWVKEEELARITLEAPDFFAFRNRVVEFMEPLLAEERRPDLVDFAMETDYKSLDEIKRSIKLKEKLLDELSGEDEISGYLLSSLGIIYHQIGDYNKSIEYCENALKVAQNIGDKESEGVQLGNLGNAYGSLGDVKKSTEYYEKALQIARKIDDRINEGAWLGNLGIIYRDFGKLEQSIEYFEKALIIAKETKRGNYEVNSLVNLGIAYYTMGKMEKAMEQYEKALAISNEMGYKRGVSSSLGSLGIAYYTMGDMEKAIEYYEKALKIVQEMGDKGNEWVWFGNIGQVYQVTGEIEKGIGYYKKALAISNEIGDRHGEISCLNNIGSAFGDKRKYKEAFACFLYSKNICTEINHFELKKTESNLEKLKKELGEKEFEKLEAEVAPKAKEIVNQILESKLY